MLVQSSSFFSCQHRIQYLSLRFSDFAVKLQWSVGDFSLFCMMSDLTQFLGRAGLFYHWWSVRACWSATCLETTGLCGADNWSFNCRGGACLFTALKNLLSDLASYLPAFKFLTSLLAILPDLHSIQRVWRGIKPFSTFAPRGLQQGTYFVKQRKPFPTAKRSGLVCSDGLV